MRIAFIFTLLASFLFFSCKKSLSPEEQLKADIEKIEKYLADHSLTAQKTDSGLYYIITKDGTGGHPATSSTVKVRYKGYLLDGSVFDETGTNTANFALYNLIEGWREGIPLLKKGGKGTFFIPSGLGYGDEAKTGIPANSVLIFEIELVDFQ